MSSYKPLELKRPPRVTPTRTKETKFWEKFQSPVIFKEYAAVTNVDFCPIEPHDYAVTAGSRVQIYSCSTNKVKKTISRFKETAYCARYRLDGQLLVAGGEEGIVRIFDLNSRFILRQFKGHAKSVRCVQFTKDGIHIVSGSDDTSLRYWDIATETSTAELREHNDYVRCLAVNPASSSMVLSGSYDHSVRIWDLRSKRSSFKLDHGAPVEAILVFPTGSTCLTAGGNYIKVWDLLSNGRPFCGFSNHQKTITSLSFDGSCHRLLSGGLDRHLKVYNIEDYRVIESFTYPAPILSVAMSPCDRHVSVGMTTRLLSVRHQPHKTKLVPTPAFPFRPSHPRPGTHRYFMRGLEQKPSEDEYIVNQSKKQQLEEYDYFLRRFKFKQTLDKALNTTQRYTKGQIVYSVLQELARMDRLHSAITGRTEKEILPLLIFLRKNLMVSAYTPFLADVCEIVIDIYGKTVFQSKEVKCQFLAIKSLLDQEIKFQNKAFQLIGIIDTILTAATINWYKEGGVTDNGIIVHKETSKEISSLK